MLDLISRTWHRWDLRKRVRRHGWTAIYVGDYESIPTWAYSIGFRQTLGAPEVIVFDLPQDVANSLFWQLFEELRSGEVVIGDGGRWGDPPHRACWRRVHPSRLDEDDEPWLGLAQTMHLAAASNAGEFEAFQLVLPDNDGRLPWEPGYDERLRARQPALYMPQGADPGPLAEPAAV